MSVACFIRKNTPELKESLKKLGCIYNGKASEVNQPYLYYNNGRYWEVNSKPARGVEVVDCGENENLFLALAALRTNTDKNQWFTDGEIVELCLDDMPSKYMQLNGHKCTVDELRNIFI